MTIELSSSVLWKTFTCLNLNTFFFPFPSADLKERLFLRKWAFSGQHFNYCRKSTNGLPCLVVPDDRFEAVQASGINAVSS